MTFVANFVLQKGLVIPISLVSRTPSVVPNTLCKLLVANATSSQSKAPNDKLLNTQTNKPVSLHNMPTDLSVEDSNLVSGTLNYDPQLGCVPDCI